MPFLGKNPTAGFASIVKDDLTPDGSTTAFTLSKNVASANDIAVFVGNVRQEPTYAYSVSGTTLTMTAAPASGLNFYVLHIAGTVESSVVPAAGTTVPGNFGVSGQMGIGTDTHYDNSTKITATGRINTSNGTVTGSMNYGGGSVVNIGAMTNHPVQIMSNNQTILRVDTSGLSFDDGSNYMSSWETGTFDCSITQGGGTASTQTEEGYYAKLGDWVYVHGQTTITSVGSGGGILRITLPFSAVGGYRGALSVGINQALSLPSTAGNGYMNIIVELGSTAAYLVGTAIGGGHHHMGIGDVSTGLFSFGGVYRAA